MSDDTEHGPKLLAWWTDGNGTDWQFLQQYNWYGVRYRQGSEWLYLGDWVDCSQDTESDRGEQ